MPCAPCVMLPRNWPAGQHATQGQPRHQGRWLEERRVGRTRANPVSRCGLSTVRTRSGGAREAAMPRVGRLDRRARSELRNRHAVRRTF
eukprot:335554-Chlamydomonas_euryale.AAC.2